MTERVTCPACGKRVLIRQKGTIQNHDAKGQPQIECRLSGVMAWSIKRAAEWRRQIAAMGMAPSKPAAL